MSQPHQSRPQAIWFADCKTPEENETRRRELVAARPVLNMLSKLLEADLQPLTAVRRSDYDSPSWAAKQAHYNGEVAQIKKQLSLITYNP